MIKKFFQHLLGVHPDAMSFKQGLDLTGLPIVTFRQGNQRFNFILDTGSDYNVIHSGYLDRIEHQMLPEEHDGTSYGLDGTKINTQACTINLEYNNKEYPYIYVIRDLSKAFEHMKRDHGVTVHGLLGSCFFNSYKYILDFQELIAYSKA